VASRGPVQVVSLILLFFTASGIFEPLEVALNRIWNCPKNRNYFKNQLVSLGLIFACGALMLASTTLTVLNKEFLSGTSIRQAAQVANILGLVLFKAAAIPMSMLVLFLIYWLLPNCKIQPARLVAPAIVVGLLLELLKYVNLWTWPYLRTKLQSEYGPFYYTVTIILWGFLAALVVLAGAEWTARRTQAGVSPRDSS
jgi:uncharacterized BrkB/YihY/UPF0761 family membrane protein